MDGFYTAIRQLPPFLSATLEKVGEETAVTITELRLRSGRPVTVSTGVHNSFVCANGILSDVCTGTVLCTTHAELQECFLSLCRYSVPRYERMLANGFIPLGYGHRAGVCGSALWQRDGSFSIQNITSVNIRIARVQPLTEGEQLSRLLRTQKSGILVSGEPGSGKTTVLRQIMQVLSMQGVRTAVVDERLELAPVEETGFLYDMPLYCDVLSGYPKHIGMQHALRALSPQVLICDEIGGMQDAQAIADAVNAGVQVIASIHADSIIAMQKRPQCSAVLQTGAFNTVLQLCGRDAPGQIQGVYPLGSYH